MKNLFIYAAVIAATMGSMTACSDFLDVKPVTNKQEPDFVSQEGITPVSYTHLTLPTNREV